MNIATILRYVSFAGAVTLLIAAQPTRAEPLMFVPLGSEDRIIAIDAATDQIVDSISGVTAVHGLAGTPDGKFLIAGSFEERGMDGRAPAKPEGVSEDEHAAHHGGSDMTTASGGAKVSTVTIIRTADGSVARSIDVPGAVHHVTVSPNGRLAALTHPNEGGISVVDLDTYEVTATVETGPLPNYAAFSPDGHRIYVSNAGNDTVSAVDAKHWTVRWNARVGGSPEHVVLSPDGATLYVNNVDDGTVSMVDIAKREEVNTLFGGKTLHGIDFSDDGKTLFVAVLGEDRLAAFNLETGTRQSAVLAPEPYHLAAIRGTGKLYISSADEPKIWVVDQRNLAVLGEISIGGKGHQMVQGAGM